MPKPATPSAELPPVQKPITPPTEVPPVRKPTTPAAELPPVQKPTTPAVEPTPPIQEPVAPSAGPKAAVAGENWGIPEGGVPISQRAKIKGVKIPAKAAQDPEGWYYDPKSKHYRKVLGRPSGAGDASEAEALRQRDIAARAKAEKRLEELRAEVAKTESEQLNLRKQRDALRDEENNARQEMKQAVAEEDAARARKDVDAQATARQKARDAKVRADAASRARKELPTEEGLYKDLKKLAGEIEVESINADPNSRGKLPCFAGDTLVATPVGPRRIDALRENDLVWAYDFSDPAPRPCRVTQTHLNIARDFVEIDVGGILVRATGRHRFWVEDGAGWVVASALRPGMRLRSLDGLLLEIVRVTPRNRDPEPSYNLSVDGHATYFVGAGVLVHNGPVDLGLGSSFIIYRATNKVNPEFAGKVYVGQTTELNLKGRPRGHAARGGEHQTKAAKQIADHAAGRIKLSARDELFYNFMKDAEIEPVVRGIASKAQADYLEQLNLKIERKVMGAANVINRREQIASESHMKAVVEAHWAKGGMSN